jgi:hypothetical protein
MRTRDIALFLLSRERERLPLASVCLPLSLSCLLNCKQFLMERAPIDVHAAPPAAAPADISTKVTFLQEYPGALTPSNEVSERATASASGSPERKHAPPRTGGYRNDGWPAQPNHSRHPYGSVS